jgi:PhnB protein
MTQAIPTGYNSLTACFTFKDCKKAIAFYKNALGAEVVDYLENSTGTGVMHASMKIGNSMIMMGEETSSENCPKSAETTGSSPISLYIYVPNVDAVFDTAVAAGGKVVMPVAEMFWGDRCGTFKDPFGYTWMIGTHTKDLTNEQIRKGAEEFSAQMQNKK